jgi:hypothetical protein
MIERIKKVLASVSVGLLLAVSGMPLAVVHADIKGGLNCGADLNASQIGSQDLNCPTTITNPGGKVDEIIKLVINIFSLIVGVVSVIMIIIGGLKYITSGGDSGNVTGAKNTIMYAIIGLVVVALAQIVVKFVLEKVAV